MLHRRSALRISCVTLAFVLASCERDATAPNAVRQLPRQSQYVTAPPITVYGPATFTRTIGKPRVDSASFNTTAGDTVTFTFESSARLGAADTVEFNDQTIFTVTDTTTFPARVHAVTWAVNTLRVLQAGKPGSNLTIVATVAPPPPPSAPWWNAFLDFNGGVLPTGWDTRLLGGDNPGLVHDRLESQPVDNGPWVRSIGPAPAGLLGIVVEYDGQAAQSTWGNGQAIDLWTGNVRNTVGQVNATYNFGAGNAQYFAAHLESAPSYTGDTVPFTAGDHRYRVVIRQDSVLWSSRLMATNAPEFGAVFPSPGWDLTQIDSVGVRAQASDVAAWLDNVHFRAITDLATTATLDLPSGIGTVALGQSMSLGFEARNIRGALLTGKTLAWTSLNPNVATVDAAGVVTAIAAGTATITATVDGAVGYAAVLVPAPDTPVLAILQASAKYTPTDSGPTLGGGFYTGDPGAAIDGNVLSNYSSRVRIADDADQWWQADLGFSRSLTKVRVLWAALEPSWWKQIQVRGSADGTTWTTLAGTSTVNIDGTWTEFPVSGGYRYLRVYLMGSGSPNHGLDLAEFEVHGNTP